MFPPMVKTITQSASLHVQSLCLLSCKYWSSDRDALKGWEFLKSKCFAQGCYWITTCEWPEAPVIALNRVIADHAEPPVSNRSYMAFHVKSLKD